MLLDGTILPGEVIHLDFDSRIGNYVFNTPTHID
jgi:hypothetical protein